MNNMFGYFIAFLVCFLLFAACETYYLYAKSKKSKQYDLLPKAGKLFWVFAAIFASWVFLELIASGFDSGYGWWLLCFAIGWSVTGALTWLLVSALKKKWPAGDAWMTMEICRIPKWVELTAHLLMVVLSIALGVFFAYGTFFAGKEAGIKIKILVGVVLILIVWAVIGEIKKIIKLQK